MANYRNLTNCLCCDSEHLKGYLDLGNQPLANSYHKGIELKTYPLEIKACQNCWHSQLSISVDPKEMFEHYLYVSDTSKTLRAYFEQFTELVASRNKVGKVLEIASNSGMLLEMFHKKGFDCLGVDPAKNLTYFALARGLKQIVKFWDINLARELAVDNKFDLIIAMHVLPHVPNPREFLAGCKLVLNQGGKIYVQTSQCDMFTNYEFDAIYHEHCSYFTANSFKHLAEFVGLKITGAWKMPIHSMSFLFELSVGEEHCEEFLTLVKAEENKQEARYKQFAINAEETKQKLLCLLNELRNAGSKIVGYGAAAKGNTLLNYINFKLDYIVDDNSMKCSYLTPGMNIPIVPLKNLVKEKDDLTIVILAWNFAEEIKIKIQNLRKNKDKFITYFPEINIT